MKLILGSKSPRRNELLNLLGYKFDVRVKETDESFPDTLDCNEVAIHIAKNKAIALMDEISENEILICADTIVVLDKKILGKPINREEAIVMLMDLSGQEHKVITGVVVATKKEQVKFSVTTKVVFHPITLEEITYYVDNFKPFDKAGSYGIQEWIGCIAIKSIEGSYNNVVGLPTHEVYQVLKKYTID